MEKSKAETYSQTLCNDIPSEYLKDFIKTYLISASADMGQTYDKDITPDRVFDMIKTHYHHLPLFLIESAFKRGALGQYGIGRLVPRTIFGWLGEMNQYYMTCHEKRDQSQDNNYKFDGLEKYPLGKAICWKIDHATEENWDKIPLKQVAEIIGAGHEPSLEYFGINNKS